MKDILSDRLKNITLCMLFMFAPLGNSSNLFLPSQGSKIFVCLSLLFICITFAFSKGSFADIGFLMKSWIIFLAFHTVCSAFFMIESFELMALINYFRVLYFSLTGICIYWIIKQDQDGYKYLFFLITGLLVFNSTGGNFVINESKNIYQMGGSLGSPNSLATYTCITMLLSILLSEIGRTKWCKVGIIILLVLQTRLLLMTNSRGNLLALSLGLMFLLLLIKPVKNKFLYICIFAFIVFSGLVMMPDRSFQSLKQRIGLSYFRQYNESYKRVNIWEAYLSGLNTRMIAGTGRLGQKSIVSGQADRIISRKTTHNTYLEVLVEYGVVGLLLFLFSHISLLLKAYWKYLKENCIESLCLAALFFTWIIIFLFYNVLTSRIYWLSLFAALAVEKQNSFNLKKSL